MNELPKDFQNFQKNMANAIDNIIPRKFAKAGQDYFEDSFRSQSWDGKPWDNVERRKAGSSWYGFQYKAGGKGKRNFSTAATTRAILTGMTGELGDSIRNRVETAKIIWSTDKVYAEVQNEGGDIKVFGKHPAKIISRQFMGFSLSLNKDFDKIVEAEIDTVFKT